DEGAREIAQALKVNSTLREIHVYGNPIVAEIEYEIKSCLNKNSQVEAALKDIQEGIKTEISLYAAGIGYERVKRVAEALKLNHTVIKIYLCLNNIGVEGAREIAQALKVNSTLREIYLDDKNIGAEIMDEIKILLKNNLENYKLECRM
ncbi:MAG: hypothetical protein ACK559_35345, partial [bacterium]